jgi:uncharacterized protein YjbI with pentapeptide repeats
MADFTEADLSGADLSWTMMVSVNLRGAKLHNCESIARKPGGGDEHFARAERISR